MKPSPLLERWQMISSKIDALSLRERGFVLLSAVALVYLVWDVVIFSPLAESKATIDQSVAQVQQKIAALHQEEKTLLLTINADPDRELKQQIEKLQTRVQLLDDELSELSVGLVPVEQLVQILQDVLKQTGALRLQSLRTLPVEQLQLSGVVLSGEDQNADSNGVDISAGVYKHTVALAVSGSFFQLLSYLEQLEQMSWRFYWDELHYERTDYPRGLIHLRVYTLSTDEGLLGV